MICDGCGLGASKRSKAWITEAEMTCPYCQTVTLRIDGIATSRAASDCLRIVQAVGNTPFTSWHEFSELQDLLADDKAFPHPDTREHETELVGRIQRAVQHGLRERILRARWTGLGGITPYAGSSHRSRLYEVTGLGREILEIHLRAKEAMYKERVAPLRDEGAT